MSQIHHTRNFRFPLTIFIAALCLAGCSDELGTSTRISIEEVPSVSLEGGDAEVSRTIAELYKVVKNDPSNSRKLGDLAMAYEMQGYLDAALGTYRLAETVDGTNAIWPYYQALIHASFGDLRQSIEYMDRSLGLQSDHAPAWLWYGMWLLESNQLEEARHAFETAAIWARNFTARLVKYGFT